MPEKEKIKKENLEKICGESKDKHSQIDTIPTEEECVLLAIQFQIQQFFKGNGIAYKSSWDYKNTIYNYLDWLQKLT